ncbi:MAG: hypothetical protein M8860_07550 [marine benthic group bacterium]|nr:hypothetical protein [Candidatus Carthagonibacter metallireducens]MCL7975652.1 hypothetical protein [Gemmatimonadota bacterium]MCL7977978.1 hypothetical protein [Gemmatimonadota bacterium]MCL7990357.1 hypothetical protein [Gemmatimonadota bacterium]
MYDGNGTSGSSTTTSAIEAELATRLHALGRRVSPIEICDLWVFPPLPDVEESGDFVLFTRVLADEMRRVCAVEFTDPPASSNGTHAAGRSANGNGSAGNGSPEQGSGSNGANGNGASRNSDSGHEPGIPSAPLPTVRITEYGRVPVGRVQRVVDGFRRRLGDHREPLHVRVDGCPQSWLRMLAEESSSG